jgi:hypothetical protein
MYVCTKVCIAIVYATCVHVCSTCTTVVPGTVPSYYIPGTHTLTLTYMIYIHNTMHHIMTYIHVVHIYIHVYTTHIQHVVHTCTHTYMYVCMCTCVQ